MLLSAKFVQSFHRRDYMPLTHIPKYPVVDPAPSLKKVLLNFDSRDIAHVSLFTGAGYVWGWMSCKLFVMHWKLQNVDLNFLIL